jgi:hypothetical protein
MSFTAEQIEAVRHAFFLANFDGELRTLPVDSDHERIFIVPAGTENTMGCQHCLEVVVSQLLDRRVLVTSDVGAPTVAFE